MGGWVGGWINRWMRKRMDTVDDVEFPGEVDGVVPCCDGKLFANFF